MYYFDHIVNRKNTNSIKVDFNKKYNMSEDVIPMWVADMDFETVPNISEAIKKRAEHGIYGYTYPKEDYYEVLINWMKKHHNWETKEAWYVCTPGVVFAISMAIRALTKEEDSVLIQRPVYYPFSRVIIQNNRKLVNNALVYKENEATGGKYEMNIKEFEEEIIKNQVKVFVLCNPHNPVGRVWTKEELEQVGEICLKHNVYVISDEIHQDFIYPGHKHIPFASIKKEFEEISITCTSPSKTFNLAGLQLSNIVIPNEKIKDKVQEEIEKTGYDEPNIFGMIACKEAYTSGEKWLLELNHYLFENINFIKEFIKQYLPKVKLVSPEGTYLVWLDFSLLGLSDEELNEKIRTESKLWLDEGTMFGEEGAGFQRVNIAVPREVLKKAFEALRNL